MTDLQKRKIIAKILALLSKRMKAGCTKEEEDAAYKLAGDLMEKYGITPEDLSNPDYLKTKVAKPEPPPVTATRDDFYAYPPEHKYIYTPTRTLWPAASIDSILGRGMGVALDRTKACQQMTWCPGKPIIIPNQLVIEGGWIDEPGARTFNLYLPPKPIAGDPNDVKPWLDHGEKMFGDDLRHIVQWLAWKVQHPDIKINHGLVIGSKAQGIGKDSWLAPVKRAVGPWNFLDKGARQAMNPDYNGFLRSTILRISEAHDLGEKRFMFYDHTKDWFAGPPETLSVADKYVGAHPIFNVVGPIVTTNHKTDGLFLPPDDRRHYVAWSEATPEDFLAIAIDYWKKLWGWYGNGGLENVACYLATLDLRDFDPHAPPPKTEAWKAIVDANRAHEDSELADVLDAMGADPLGEAEPERPEAILLAQVIRQAARGEDGIVNNIYGWLKDQRNYRAIPHKLDLCGYSPVRNQSDKAHGQWKIKGKRHTAYALTKLNPRDRLKAVKEAVRYEARWQARHS